VQNLGVILVNRILLSGIVITLAGCASYPEFLDKKLEVTKTSYRLDGSIESVTVTEHTPSTMGQEAISNAKVDMVVPNCSFDMDALSEVGEVAFAVGQAAGVQMNPCLNGSALVRNQTNMFDRDIAQAKAQSGITSDLIGSTVIGLGIKTAGDVLEAGFDSAGDEYTVGNVTQSTQYASQGAPGGAGGTGGLATTETGDPIGGEGSEGGASGAAGGGTNGNTSLNIGRANANATAGVDAVAPTGLKSGNGDNYNDQDGLINNGTDESDNNVNASVTIPVGVN